MSIQTTQISTLRDENDNIIIPLTHTEAVLYKGEPITKVLDKFIASEEELATIKTSIQSIEQLLLQINEKLNDHTSE